MAKLISKYLKQIEEKLKDKSIPSEYIEEFIDNLADQLATMLEEVQEKEPTLSSEDVEVSVLTQCEPVDKVVERVIKELKADEPWITADRFSSVKFLRPFESTILAIFQKLDRGLVYCKKRVHRFSKWYIKHENPVFTSLTFFITIILLTTGIGLIFTFLPSVYQTTTLPDNKTYYTLNRPLEPSGRYSEVIYTEISYSFQIVLIIILIFGAIGYIGWKYSYRYALMSGALLSLLIGSWWISVSPEDRLLTISNRVISEVSGSWSFTSDWVRAIPPTTDDFAIFVLNYIFSSWFYFIIFLILLISAGFLLKTIIKRNKIITSRPHHLNTLLKIGLFLSCLVIGFIIPPPGPPRMFLYKDAPIPTTNEPLIYEFDIDWTTVYQGRKHSEDYFTRIREFGDLGFYFYEYFNISISNVNTEEPNLTSKGSFTQILTKDEEPSVSSLQPFALLGLLYLPNKFNGLIFQEIIASYLNDSYPFRGFTPSIDNTIQHIEWHVNGTDYNLTVNTIKYSSTTNGSEYTFSFDRGTGWLLKAKLTKNNDTWVVGLELETLTITRMFTLNRIDNPQDYYNINYLVMLLFILGTGLIFLSCEVFYILTQKKALNMRISRD